MSNEPASPQQDALRAAFSAAEYRVCIGGHELVLKVGMHHPELDRAIEDRDWAIVTAFNPQGRRVGDADNRHADAALRAEVAERGLLAYPSTNRDPSGRWPDEPGLLIAGAGPDEMASLGRRHGQAALLVGRSGQPAMLCFLGAAGGVN